MVAVEKKRAIIQQLLTDLAKIQFRDANIQLEPVFDTQRDRYLLMSVGFDKYRVHDCAVHLDIIDGKVWIQCDNTDLVIARELQDAGIPKDEIVLGFREPEVRPYTGYAVA